MESSERKIGLIGTVSMAVGLVIGASIFVLIPIVVGMTGSGATLCYLLAGIPIAFSCISAVFISGSFPTSGGAYNMCTLYTSPSLTFAVSAAQTIAIGTTLCFQAFAAAAYIQLFLPNFSAFAIALFLIIIFGILNLVGVTIVDRIQNSMAVILTVFIIVFIIGGFSITDTSNFTTMMPTGSTVFNMGIGLAIFSWLGLSTLSSYAGEIKRPSKTIPKALVISCIFLAIAYGLVALVFSGVFTMEEINAAGPTVAKDVVLIFGGEILANIFVIGIICAILTTINACYMVASREMVAWANQMTGPAIFGKISPKTKVPTVDIIITMVIAIGFAFFAMRLEEYALVLVYPIVIYAILQAIACLKMPSMDPERYAQSKIKIRKGILVFSLFGNVITGALVMYFTYTNSVRAAMVATVLLAGSIVWYYVRRLYLRSKGIELDAQVRQLSEFAQWQIDNQ